MKISNTVIKPNGIGGWLVVGDTNRFGKQNILFEAVRLEDCYEYLKKNESDFEFPRDDNIKTAHGYDLDNALVYGIYLYTTKDAYGLESGQVWELDGEKLFIPIESYE